MDEARILVVDDNANNLALLTGLLQEAGYEVRAANSGRRALQLVERQMPDLILLDVTMPEMDGYEVCRHLKASAETSAVPVIFVSALDDVFDKVRAFETGGVDYVTKPFQAAEVLARVGSQLRISRLQRELERRNAELERRNEELVRANRKTEQMFMAFSDVLPGTVLGDRYRIDECIGEGGFGHVFRGVLLEIERPVAIKVLRPTSTGVSPKELARLRNEGVVACRVDHPNAVEVLDFGVTPTGVAYLVMELLRGQTLERILDNAGVLPLMRCAELMAPVCDALAEAHRQGVVHRDIKPDNVIVHDQKGVQVVKVVDFGVAKLFEEADPNRPELTEDGVVLGTPSYMAPERVLGEPYDGASDVYSVGVVIYRALCGALPFGQSSTGNPYVAALMHVRHTPRPPSEINPDVTAEAEALVLRALAKRPENRPTAAEMADELRYLAGRR